jgi:hypothetical protein
MWSMFYYRKQSETHTDGHIEWVVGTYSRTSVNAEHVLLEETQIDRTTQMTLGLAEQGVVTVEHVLQMETQKDRVGTIRQQCRE